MTAVRETGLEALEKLCLLALRSNDTPYALDRVIEEKCFAAGADGLPRVGLAETDGRLTGAAVVCGRYLRLLFVDREFRNGGTGSALLNWAEGSALQHGETRLVLGGEPGNYFVPGLQRTENPATTRFFEKRGFRSTGEAINLFAHVAGTDWRARHRPGSFTLQRAEDPEPALDFIGREFGRLWRFEVSHAFDSEVPPLFIAVERGDIIGFSAHDVNNRGLGVYGPAGVLRERRGGGVGRELLLASLADLADRGYDRIIIPWVSSIDFYRKVASAEIDVTFTTMEKKL
jgi:GNAT superfamily N-acetyltransferase